MKMSTKVVNRKEGKRKPKKWMQFVRDSKKSNMQLFNAKFRLLLYFNSFMVV